MKSWPKIRGEMSRESQARMDARLEETLTFPPKPDAPDDDLFRKLRREVEDQLSTYVYRLPEGSGGNPLSAEQIRRYLDAMRPCLVDPRWEPVKICHTSQESWTGEGVERMCVTMAEDEAYVLTFDPVDEQYHLAFRSEDGLGTWGICGDAVGCFIAR